MIILGLITLYSMVIGWAFKITAIHALANIYLQFFITFVPGLAIYTIIRKKPDEWINVIAISYALGYGINILEYFLLMPFGLGEILRFFAPIVSLFAAIYLIRNPFQLPTPQLNVRKDCIPIIVFFLMLIMDVLIYSGTQTSPVLTGSSTYSRDIQYWVNVTVGLFLNFPPQAPYLSGYTLYYHYFSNIHVAFSSLVSGIDIFPLSFPLYPLTKSLLLIGGVNYLLNTFNATKTQKVVLMTALFFSTGIERISLVTNFHHFHLSPFGLDISFAFGAFFIAFFTERFKESDAPIDWPSYFITLLFYAVMVGSKAPLAAVLSVYPAVLCLAWLSKKKYRHAIAYGIGIVVIFLSISIFCVGVLNAVNNLSDSQNMQVSNIDKLVIGHPFSSVYLNLIYSTGIKIFASQPFLIVFFGAAIIKFSVDLYKKRLPKKEIPVKIALISAAIFSIILSQLIDHSGNSEMYFMIAAYLPMIALAVDILAHLSQQKIRSLSNSLTAIALIMLVIQIYCFLFDAWGGYSAARSIKQGFNSIASSKGNFLLDAGIPINSIQKSDVEGLEWIRKNTPKDALLAVDRASFYANGTNQIDYFNYAMFAERHTYIEGTSMIYVLKGASDKIVSQRQQLITALFNNSNDACHELKAEGVDYIVQTKWLTPQFKPACGLELVHSTESLNIYQFQTPAK